MQDHFKHFALILSSQLLVVASTAYAETLFAKIALSMIAYVLLREFTTLKK